MPTQSSSELYKKNISKKTGRKTIRTGHFDPNSCSMIGESESMNEVYKAIGRVAASDATVLILGETGTGKELVARAIYSHSLRAEKPLITLNCAAVPGTLLESKLFGHEKGAFTGATQRRIGKFEQAQGASIFLDEIGELSLETQSKLLRVLQFQEIERLGSNDTIKIDVRIIAATNRNLENDIEDKTFREDLYHRLNVFPIIVPPLRERKDDIPLLIRFFFDKFTEQYRIPTPMITGKAVDMLCDHNWSGNVRELEHCIQRSILLSGGYPITETETEEVLGENTTSHRAAEKHHSKPIDEILKDYASDFISNHKHNNCLREFMNRVEATMISEALTRTSGNQTRAAEILGVSWPSVQAKIKKHRLEPRTVVN